MNKIEGIITGLCVLTLAFYAGAIAQQITDRKYNKSKVASAEKVAELFDVMNQRICDLEDKAE